VRPEVAWLLRPITGEDLSLASFPQKMRLDTATPELASDLS
jgi:hypothetical protein